MQAVAEVEEDHDESRRRDDKSQWRHDERGAKRTLGEGMWSVSTAVRTRVTACGGPAAPRRPESEVDAAEPPQLQLWRRQGTSGGAGAPAQVAPHAPRRPGRT